MALPLLNKSFVQRVAADLMDKNKEASRALPSSKGGETPKQLQTYRTEVYSYFTVPSAETQLFYSAENWVTLKMTLETAGPVAVGTSDSLAPVLSGRGRLLNTGAEYEVHLAKGTRFFITSQTVNRVSITIEPIPWLEQIDHDTVVTQIDTKRAVMAVGASIVNAINALRGMGKTTGSSGKTIDQLPPAPAGDRRMIPRLTGLGPARKNR